MTARAFLKVFLLSLLLLGLQHEAQVHPLGHDADRLRAATEHGVVAQCVAEPCVACELLAGGCGAAVPRLPGLALSLPATVQPAPSFAPAYASPFVSYRTRAPPVLL
jgi:hypothetical protein